MKILNNILLIFALLSIIGCGEKRIKITNSTIDNFSNLHHVEYPTIELFDIVGKKVKTIYEGKIPSGNKNFFINAAKLCKGIYFVKLQTKEYSVSQKLLVK